MLSLKSTKDRHWLLDQQYNPSDAYADVALRTGVGSEITSHKIIVASLSPLLEKLLSDVPSYPGAVVLIPDTDEETLKQLFAFAQSEEVVFESESSYNSLLELMHLLEIDYISKCHVVTDERQLIENEYGSLNGTELEEFSYENEESAVTSKLLLTNGSYDQRTICDDSIRSQEPSIKKEFPGRHVEHFVPKTDPKRNQTSTERMQRKQSAFAIKKELDNFENNPVMPQTNESIPSVADFPDLMHPCEFCEKCFSSSTHLQKHVNRYHRSDHRFRCKQCASTFSSNGNLRLHIRTIHEQVPAFKCDLCEKSFRRKDALESHHTIIHLKLKPFSCDLCMESFSLKQNLDTHLRKHTGEKPFCCAHCGKSFMQSSSLRNHEISSHSNAL